MDKDKIEEEYDNLIRSFVDSYENSPLRNDPDQIHHAIKEFD